MALLQSYSDQQLVALLREGNELAFTELYNRYWERLLAMACHRLRDLSAAEDVVHDVFISFWIHRQSANIRHPDRYLATAVKYAILKSIRKTALHRYHAERLALSVSAELPSPAIDQNPAIDQKRIDELLQREIERLPEKCQLTLVYKKKGLSNPEIAAEMKVSIKTVENQINKGLKQLRLALKSALSFFSFF